MPNQVLIIEPQNELKFKGLFDQGHTTHMKLTNPTSNTVLFKIKTTAPKKYYVRPNSGVLEPNAKVDIAITPQHFYVDPNETHKHKFMVQSVIAPDNKTNIDQVWKETHPNQLMDYKLRCVFVSPREGNTNDAGDTAAQNEVTKKLVAVAEEGKPPAPQSVSKEELVSVTKSMKAIDEEEKADDSAFSKSENVENDMQKVSSEVIHLREEESKLRHENLRLKEELLRLHQQVGGEHMAQRSHSYAPDRKEQLSVPWLGITLAMALLGIIIGKFFM